VFVDYYFYVIAAGRDDGLCGRRRETELGDIIFLFVVSMAGVGLDSCC